MTDLVVKSGVQQALDDHPISADLYDALDEEVAALLEEAARRAEANDRQTVMAQDLWVEGFPLNKLHDLEAETDLTSKKVSGRSRVW